MDEIVEDPTSTVSVVFSSLRVLIHLVIVSSSPDYTLAYEKMTSHLCLGHIYILLFIIYLFLKYIYDETRILIPIRVWVGYWIYLGW